MLLTQKILSVARVIYVVFVVFKMALGHVYLRPRWFSPLIYHSKNISCSFVYSESKASDVIYCVKWKSDLCQPEGSNLLGCDTVSLGK